MYLSGVTYSIQDPKWTNAGYSIAFNGSSNVIKPSIRKKTRFKKSGKHALITALIAALRRRNIPLADNLLTIFRIY